MQLKMTLFFPTSHSTLYFRTMTMALEYIGNLAKLDEPVDIDDIKFEWVEID